MKKNLFLVAVLFLSSQFLFAQKDYKVVFDLTSKDTLDQRSLLRWVDEVGGIKDAQLEIVMYGQGVHMVKNSSPYAEKIAQLMQNKNINFKVCAVALKAQGIDTKDLIPGIQTVPDGIYEIITKQHEGWGYIKAVH